MAITVDSTDSENNNNGGTAATPNNPTPAPTVKPQPAAPAPQPAVQSGSFGENAPRRQQAVPLGQKTQTNNTTTQTNQGLNSTMSISSRHNYGYSRAPTSQAMRSIVEAIDIIAEGEPNQPVAFSYIALDGDKEGLLISALVVTAALKTPGTGQKYVAHHTLILAATAKGVTSVEQQFGQNLKYERVVVPADAFDAKMRGRVVEAVKQAFPGHLLIDADASVVPVTLDLKSPEAVRNIASNASSAASAMLSSVVANDGWVIDAQTLENTYQNEIKASHDHFADLTGLPVRGDVVLEMSELLGKNVNQNNNNGEFQYNNAQSKKLITQMLGYIDITSTPPQGGVMFGHNGYNQADQLKIYTPRLVITNVDSPEVACELPVILQGLATTQALINDNRWVSALIQQHKNGATYTENGMNLRDLSVIGLEAPAMPSPLGYPQAEAPKPARLPLNSANVNDGILASTIMTYFNNDLLVSLDVQECGPSSWITAPFAAAARGDQQAIRDLFEASDLLTNGQFTPIYKALCGGVMKPPMFNDNMYVNLGFYESTRGRRDIRDVDYLTVLNGTGDQELDTINDWANLQANAEVDPMFRLSTTRDIQQALFESMVITGRAVRVTVNPLFIHALADAVAAAGLVYDTKIGMAAPQGTSRMIAPYMRNLPTGLGNAGAFVAPGMRRNNTGGNSAASFGRYATMQANSAGQSGNF